MGYLVVVEVVYEGDEAPGLVLQRKSQQGNVADKYSVKQPSHLQVVTGTQRLETRENVLVFLILNVQTHTA